MCGVCLDGEVSDANCVFCIADYASAQLLPRFRSQARTAGIVMLSNAVALAGLVAWAPGVLSVGIMRGSLGVAGAICVGSGALLLAGRFAAPLTFGLAMAAQVSAAFLAFLGGAVEGLAVLGCASPFLLVSFWLQKSTDATLREFDQIRRRLSGRHRR